MILVRPNQNRFGWVALYVLARFPVRPEHRVHAVRAPSLVSVCAKPHSMTGGQVVFQDDVLAVLTFFVKRVADDIQKVLAPVLTVEGMSPRYPAGEFFGDRF